jgi:hypothetical protein
VLARTRPYALFCCWLCHRNDCCCRPSAGEEELRQKQLQTFCGMMLERYEDEVLDALTTDAFSTPGEHHPHTYAVNSIGYGTAAQWLWDSKSN